MENKNPALRVFIIVVVIILVVVGAVYYYITSQRESSDIPEDVQNNLSRQPTSDEISEEVQQKLLDPSGSVTKEIPQNIVENLTN